jgi:acyl carrier protein
LSRHFRFGEIREDDDIFALGFVNSLMAMQLVMFVEQEFQISIVSEDLDFENFKTINAIVRLIDRKRTLPATA